jgi:uncharacterized membrane protein YeaQ/YmgE (transglycosylase-associated protein family)
MTLDSILLYSFFGLFTTTLAQLLDSKPTWGGNIGTLMLGICGAILGGTLAHFLFGYGFDKNLLTLSLTVAGSLILLLMGKTMKYTYS